MSIKDPNGYFINDIILELGYHKKTIDDILWCGSEEKEFYCDWITCQKLYTKKGWRKIIPWDLVIVGIDFWIEIGDIGWYYRKIPKKPQREYNL